MNSSGLEKITVNDLKADAQIIASDISISKVIGSLKQSGNYQVFTQIGDKVGIISMRDLLKVTNITTRKASSIIQYIPQIKLNQKIESIASIMEEYRVRGLPIVEDNEIIGQISSMSIVNAMNRDYLKKFKITSIMTQNPIILDVNELVTKARKIFIQKKIDHIPITKNKKLVGVTSSDHLVFRMLPSEGVETGAFGSEKEIRLDFPLKMILDVNPVICNVETNIAEALEIIIKQQSTYIVFELWDEIQGIVTYRDFLKVVSAEKSKLDIPIYIVGLPKDSFEAELTRDKFLKTVTALKKTFPDIIEARSTIQTKEIKKDRRRYEVKTMIKTPKETHSYSEGGYNLPEIYDLISGRMKRLMTKKSSKKSRISRRTENN